MQITFYQFTKRNNSTKQPANITGTPLTCQLKEQTNMINPILIIKATPAGWSPIWNYAYIPTFQRYYFINNWTWLNGCWECDAVCDVLASFKTDIGTLSEYVVRCASESNGAISDSMYPATTDFTVRAAYTPNLFSTNLAVGCYIVGIISGGSVNAVGAITYYAMDSAEFGALKEKLFSDDNLEIMHIIDSQGQALVTDISQEVLKTLYNPYQYIASCMWFPFAKSAITNKTDVNTINIGWWDYPLSGSRLYAQIISFAESINPSDHPQAAARGKYLNYSPYSSRVLIGRFGMVAINSEYFESGESIGIGYDIDLITGQCRCPIERRYYVGSVLHVDVLTERYFMIGVPIQIAQVGTDYLGTVSTAIQGIKGIADGISSGASSGAQLGSLINPGAGTLIGGIAGGVLGGAGAAVTGIYNTLNAAMPIVETSGANGSFLAPSTNTELLEHFYTVVEDDNVQKGRPLCAVRQLNTLSGYIMVDSPDVQLPCMETERQQIVSYMASGFFYE